LPPKAVCAEFEAELPAKRAATEQYCRDLLKKAEAVRASLDV
jgi:hypothetical protein